MKRALSDLAQHIRMELPNVARVAQYAGITWKQLLLAPDDAYLHSTALNLHGFYEGLERLFVLIATTVDGMRPSGADWHQELLIQMQGEMPGVRPAVISEISRRALDEFRGFRHIVRHVYSFSFNPQRVGELVQQSAPLFDQVQRELLAFADFLDQRARDAEE